MKKILSLSTKEWLSGVAQGYYYGSGIWGDAKGIYPFISAKVGGAKEGLLQAAPSVTDDTAGVVAETPIGYTIDVDLSGNKALFFNTTNSLYSAVLTQTNVASETLKRTPTPDMANGVIGFKAGSEARYLYYWQVTQIGRWDYDSSYTDAWATGLISTVHHPTHRLFDNIFYGNGTAMGNVGSIRDVSNVATHNGNELDCGTDYVITTLSDDGRYLVIGISKNLGTNGINIATSSKILFWDTNSSSWEKEWTINATDIISIKRVDTTLYALTTDGLFVFNYDTPPQKVLDFGAGAVAVSMSTTTGAHYSMDRFAGGVLWGDTQGRVNFYGKPAAGAPNAYHQPFSSSNSVTMVVGSASENLPIVGTSTPSLGHYDLESGTPGTSVSAISTYIDLQDRYRISRIDVIFGHQLASGDSVNIQVSSPTQDAVSVYADFGGTNAASFANFGAESRARLTGSIDADSLSIKVQFIGGTPKIRRIDVWGDKLET